MGLSARDRTRYARQLLLPQIGEAGQERLLASSVHAAPDAEPGVLAVARSYLERAGLRVASEPGAPTLALVSADELSRVAGDPALLEAARALTGALAAVAALREAAAFGSPVQPVVPTLCVPEEA